MKKKSKSLFKAFALLKILHFINFFSTFFCYEHYFLIPNYLSGMSTVTVSEKKKKESPNSFDFCKVL